MNETASSSEPGKPDPPPQVVVRRIEIEAKIIWQAIGAVLLTLVLLWATNQASTLVAMVAIAFFFSLALDPGVRWLVQKYGWRRGSATGIIYLGGFVFVVLGWPVCAARRIDDDLCDRSADSRGQPGTRSG